MPSQDASAARATSRPCRLNQPNRTEFRGCGETRAQHRPEANSGTVSVFARNPYHPGMGQCKEAVKELTAVCFEKRINFSSRKLINGVGLTNQAGRPDRRSQARCGHPLRVEVVGIVERRKRWRSATPGARRSRATRFNRRPMDHCWARTAENPPPAGSGQAGEEFIGNRPMSLVGGNRLRRHAPERQRAAGGAAAVYIR